MKSPAGWEEPGQTPEFDEYTVVLNGKLKVETKSAQYEVGTGADTLCKSSSFEFASRNKIRRFFRSSLRGF